MKTKTITIGLITLIILSAIFLIKNYVQSNMPIPAPTHTNIACSGRMIEKNLQPCLNHIWKTLDARGNCSTVKIEVIECYGKPTNTNQTIKLSINYAYLRTNLVPEGKPYNCPLGTIVNFTASCGWFYDDYGLIPIYVTYGDTIISC